MRRLTGAFRTVKGTLVVRLTKASLTHRTVVMLLSLLTIGLGVFAAGALKQELIPSFDLPRGTVLAVYPGAAPEVVEAQVSKPIESAVKGVAGVTNVTSKSSSGVSYITVAWDYGLDPDDMASSIRSAIESVSSSLPTSVDPKVITGSFDDIPIVVLALSSDDDLNTLSGKVTDTVVPALKTIPGVRDVTAAGEETHEIIVTYDQAAIEEYGTPAALGRRARFEVLVTEIDRRVADWPVDLAGAPDRRLVARSRVGHPLRTPFGITLGQIKIHIKNYLHPNWSARAPPKKRRAEPIGSAQDPRGKHAPEARRRQVGQNLTSRVR